MMHRLLIVDDDQIIRAGMKQSIHWEENGIEVVGTASNGRECLEMIPSCLPDIILTDIKMPFMDGVELMEAVYRLYPHIKVVLLTAYGDFKYAQLALNYKVCQYVMKYEHNSEVLKAVLKAAKESDDQKDNVEMINRSRTLLKNKFFYDLVVNYQDESDFIERAKRLHIQFISPVFCVVCIHVGKRSEREAEILLWQKKQLCNKIGELLQSSLNQPNIGVYYFVGDIYLNLVVNFSKQLSEMEQEVIFTRLEELFQQVREKQGVSLAAGAGSICNGCSNLLKSYTEATQALEMKNMLESHLQEGQTLVRFEELKNSSVSHAAVLRQVLSFIESNFHQEDLSLNRIAEEVHLTPSYISTLFKKYQGINLSDYLMELRVKKAMCLLTETEFKTYEISEKVGYNNPQYFSVVFKRIAGCAPGEYRKMNRT
ncbi:MAG: response regulator [Clostridium sp.]|uniref:response regulator n=1 Tax=Clostridium sp. TaxID=1506 RepID=UPI00290D8166|nr:response regulator [Clostridium sp.]MDU7337756.1 response regulator [Clostridium sp.]